MTPEKQKRHDTHHRKQAEALSRLTSKVAAFGDDALLDEYEFCAYVERSLQWARNRRIYGGSLPFLKIGAAVRYRFGDIKKPQQTQAA